MKNSKENHIQYPDNIVLIGGGRWARVLAEVLCDIVPVAVSITIHTFHNINPMLNWISERHLEGRIQVLHEWPKFNAQISNAVIVVNAARDHEDAIKRVLDAGVSVLVEKPITLTSKSTMNLMEYAQNHDIYFASAHIFLFSKDIENIAELVSKEQNIKSIKMHWMDPESENRHGETKHYDPGLPVFIDLLPHVMSIIGLVIPYTKQNFKSLEFLRGGAHLNIDFSIDKISCHIQLARNSNYRKRVIEIDCDENIIRLDFTNEPGTISINSKVVNNSQDWIVKRRPSERMLLAYMHGAITGEYDNRLDATIGLRANMIIDQVLYMYNREQKAYLIDRFSKNIPIDDELRYLLSEILQLEGFIGKDIIDRQIDKIQEKFMSNESKKWLDLLILTEKHERVIKSIVG